MSLDSHYDAIIVGSGFGGSVTAYRLAEAGKRVLVLERGRPYPPGSFTRSPYRARESFWDPPRGLTGMYHYWSFKGIDALVSAGLGGGSLIYANVFLRKDERWFVHEDLNDGGYEYWPVSREDLDPHYDRVEQMIKLQRYPVRARALLGHAEDDRVQGGRRGQRARVVPAPARGHVRQRRAPAGARRGDRGGAQEPSRAHADDLPAVRRVRRRLQLRRQEHARLQLPDPRQAPRRGDPHARRRAPLRPARGRRVHGRLRRPERAPGEPAAHRAQLRPPRAQRGHARHDQPAAEATASRSRGSRASSGRASAATATC